MASFLYIGDTGRDFPQDDGLHPSFTIQPGEHVEADVNPDPRWFDPVDGNQPLTPQPEPEPPVADVPAPASDAVTEGTE